MKKVRHLGLNWAALSALAIGCSAPSGNVVDPGVGNGTGAGGTAAMGGGGNGATGLVATGGSEVLHIDPTPTTGLGDGIIRDFPCNFPDFRPCDEPGQGKTCASRTLEFNAFVGPEFRDGRPYYLDSVWNDGTLTTFGASFPACGGVPCFNHWFTTDPAYNVEIPYHIGFECPADGGVCVFDQQAFFPIDNQGFGNDCAEFPEHNYGFTFELHAPFTYEPGLKFTFKGDDDVFVFINGAKVIDIAGIHPAEEATADFDTLNLASGQQCTLDFFFAERNPTDSHFRIEVSPELVPEAR